MLSRAKELIEEVDLATHPMVSSSVLKTILRSLYRLTVISPYRQHSRQPNKVVMLVSRSLLYRVYEYGLTWQSSIGDQYFLDSASRISAFFEPSALDPTDPHKLVVPKEQSINKIGHALCQLDPVFRAQTLENQRLKDLARDLGAHQDPLGTQKYH